MQNFKNLEHGIGPISNSRQVGKKTPFE